MNLYIHIPFCARRCSYCDFYTQTNLGLRACFVEALCRELELRRSTLPIGEQIEHIYLGGGTPSLLSLEELERICSCIYRLYPCAEDGERTIECNPDDVTREYAEGLKALGFNRVSMGVQSFKEEDLQFLNRRHSVGQVYDAVARLREAGLDNFSLDLIYGLPGQTAESWLYNIQRILEIHPPHISAYHLIYEEETPLTRLRDQGKVKEVSEEESLQFLQYLIRELSGAGYEHYEISNFARGGRYAQLNTGYWLGAHYLGCGPSAHGYDGLRRMANIASLDKYTKAILLEGILPQSEEVLTLEDQRQEFIMVRLRTQWGIPLDLYADNFGAQAREDLLRLAQPYLRSGKLTCEGEVLRLTQSGLFLSDAIILALWG